MAFATKPVREWNQTDVQHWLRAGFSADCAAMGWTQKLSHDYTALFHACDFDGGSLIAMQSFAREDWLAMAAELSDQQRDEYRSTVTLGDRMRIVADVQKRVISCAHTNLKAEARDQPLSEVQAQPQAQTQSFGTSLRCALRASLACDQTNNASPTISPSHLRAPVRPTPETMKSRALNQTYPSASISSRAVPRPAKVEAHEEQRRYIGLQKVKQGWAVRVKHRNQRHTLGIYASARVAAEAYDRARLKRPPTQKGIRSKLNFARAPWAETIYPHEDDCDHNEHTFTQTKLGLTFDATLRITSSSGEAASLGVALGCTIHCIEGIRVYSQDSVVPMLRTHGRPIRISFQNHKKRKPRVPARADDVHVPRPSASTAKSDGKTGFVSNEESKQRSRKSAHLVVDKTVLERKEVSDKRKRSRASFVAEKTKLAGKEASEQRNRENLLSVRGTTAADAKHTDKVWEWDSEAAASEAHIRSLLAQQRVFGRCVYIDPHGSGPFIEAEGDDSPRSLARLAELDLKKLVRLNRFHLGSALTTHKDCYLKHRTPLFLTSMAKGRHSEKQERSTKRQRTQQSEKSQCIDRPTIATAKQRVTSPEFPRLLWEILERPVPNLNLQGAGDNEAIMEWCEDGTSFAIRDLAAFEEHVLPHLGTSCDLSSFKRQLDLYGFKLAYAYTGRLGKAVQVYAHEAGLFSLHLGRVKSMGVRRPPVPHKMQPPSCEPRDTLTSAAISCLTSLQQSAAP